MKGRAGKLLRRDSAIERLTKTIAAHEAGVELTTKILEDKKLSKTPEEIEKAVDGVMQGESGETPI